MPQIDRQRLVASLLCLVTVALTGLGPAVRHAHGESSSDAPTLSALAVQSSSTHWHVDWFGVELTLPDTSRQPLPLETEVHSGLEAIMDRSAVDVASVVTDQGPIGCPDAPGMFCMAMTFAAEGANCQLGDPSGLQVAFAQRTAPLRN